MNGFTVCPSCLRTVRVTDGLIGRHVPGHWEKTCRMYKTEARWVDRNKLNAGGRNTAGNCMGCGRHVDDGENPECTQCCFAKRVESNNE